MIELLENKICTLQKKQKLMLKIAKKVDENFFNFKVHSSLSPVGWHIIHCIYIEALWIRSKYHNDYFYENLLKNIADANKVPLSKRDKGLPEKDDVLKFTEYLFEKNIILLRLIIEKKSIISTEEFYNLISFLNQHHAQHIENIKNVINLLNLNFNKNYHDTCSRIDAKSYSFNGICISEGLFQIGACKENFSYDNEKPQNKIFLSNYKISKKPITISEWLGFIKEGGYKKKKIWSSKGWYWKNKYKIFFPLNWIVLSKNRLSLSTFKGFIKPIGNMPVSNISRFELEAFANFYDLRLPHEHEWEVAFNLIQNKFKVWEWSANNFFAYDGFVPFPYKEYSLPWFNKSYFTLRGSSIYSCSDIKRVTFRNFYPAYTRYIASGGRLCLKN